MPQIGWFEIIIVVIISIIIIGPKDFPVMLKKVGSWIGAFKNYFNEIQTDITKAENEVENEISFIKDFPKIDNKNKKNE
jgi:sec-independent protein translocase protein TatB|tara:strand:+ start:319 stop:555 length:237 start_codon:yes stop_codon:yes gene_type:complete